MAQKTQIVMTDDLDGGEATQTVVFSFQGANYEIDLNDEHAASIEESFSEWINAARKLPARGTSGASRSNNSRSTSSSGAKRSDLDDVRAWARANGHTVADRGRISGKVLEAYDNR